MDNNMKDIEKLEEVKGTKLKADDITIFDTHCHLNDEEFEGIVSRVIDDAREYNVKYIAVPGFDLESSKKAVEIANSHENIYALVGIHPDDANSYTEDDLKCIIELVKNNEKVVAIGEIGLDYYWEKDEEIRKKQKELFIKQIEIANELDLPIAIHTRDATIDTISVLKENEVNRKGIIHCAPFNDYLITETLKLGYYISFSGIVTFKNAKPERAVLKVPDDRLLVETDSPYLTPEPNRGKTNMPGYTYYTLKKVSEIRNQDFKTLAKQVLDNSKKIYDI